MADLSNLTDQGCENSTGVWRCPFGSHIANAQAVFDGEIGCFSTLADSIDKGCYAIIELQKPVLIDDCTFSVDDNRNYVYNPCENVTLDNGTVMFAAFDPKQIAGLNCEQTLQDTIYVTVCYVNNSKITFDGAVSLIADDPSVWITNMTISSFDLKVFILNNLVYILLIIVILLVASWVFVPRGLEAKEMLRAKEKITPTRRETRYGRK
jgi:hypothetical protein